MLSRVGEKFGYNQMAELKSDLTKLGREICAVLEKKTDVPVYYYLHRYYGVSAKAESKRRCPDCKGEWLLKEPIGIYDFCCKKCRLFSVKAPGF
jgi:predicted  nucleic acid-binding Zn ribbon protein